MEIPKIPFSVEDIKRRVREQNKELRDKIAIEAMKELLKADFVEADHLAENCYKIADAMIKERNKR